MNVLVGRRHSPYTSLTACEKKLFLADFQQMLLYLFPDGRRGKKGHARGDGGAMMMR